MVNAYSEPDLFWALKGGGGGTFGVVTRFTLRTHDLPDYFGAVYATITAASGTAYRDLVGRLLSFYRESLFNPHWGEQLHFGPGKQISVAMVFQGLTQDQASAVWSPFFGWVKARQADYTLTGPTAGSGPEVAAVPARDFWNAAFFERSAPGTIVPDPLPGAPSYYFYWPGNVGEVGAFWYAYQSTWLSRELLGPGRQPDLVDALIAASRFSRIQLHCNKGIAGAAPDAVSRTADTAMNPAVLDSFALVIAADLEQSVYPGVPGHEPDLVSGRLRAELVAAAIAPLKNLRARPASYFNETDYFQSDWTTAFWGDHYARLLRVKERYDPDGLFTVHHGVGTGT